MEKLIKVSRYLSKLSQVDFESTVKATSKAQTSDIDTSTDFKNVDAPKRGQFKTYPVENPVSSLIPGGINVY